MFPKTMQQKKKRSMAEYERHLSRSCSPAKEKFFHDLHSSHLKRTNKHMHAGVRPRSPDPCYPCVHCCCTPSEPIIADSYAVSRELHSRILTVTSMTHSRVSLAPASDPKLVGSLSFNSPSATKGCYFIFNFEGMLSKNVTMLNAG